MAESQQRRGSRLQIRISDEERKSIAAAAKRKALPVGTFVRATMIEAADRVLGKTEEVAR